MPPSGVRCWKDKDSRVRDSLVFLRERWNVMDFQISQVSFGRISFSSLVLKRKPFSYIYSFSLINLLIQLTLT